MKFNLTTIEKAVKVQECFDKNLKLIDLEIDDTRAFYKMRDYWIENIEGEFTDWLASEYYQAREAAKEGVGFNRKLFIAIMDLYERYDSDPKFDYYAFGDQVQQLIRTDGKSENLDLF